MCLSELAPQASSMIATFIKKLPWTPYWLALLTLLYVCLILNSSVVFPVLCMRETMAQRIQETLLNSYS